MLRCSDRTRFEMKVSNRSKNVTHVTKGKIEQATGEAQGDERFSAAGRDEEMTDNLKQAGEKVNDAFKD
jgi:uncharacterized protein YjbJ (UPF0337 family)